MLFVLIAVSFSIKVSTTVMASIAGAPTSIAASRQIMAVYGVQCMKSVSFSVSFSSQSKIFTSVRMQPMQSAPMRFRVSCVAKPETVQKVCAIVKKQLALADDTKVSAESKFSSLGADSLDTVEIVMGLEEAFGISVEEDSAQTIATVQDAADLIEKLVGSKSV